jgi:hypothetical protein
MTRIELHLTEEETTILDLIAKEQGRSRKNLSETEFRKLIVGWQKKNKNVSTNAKSKRTGSNGA